MAQDNPFGAGGACTYERLASSRPVARTPSLGRQVLNLFRERREAARSRARVRRELNECSDRALSELGLGRADVENVVRGRFAG